MRAHSRPMIPVCNNDSYLRVDLETAQKALLVIRLMGGVWGAFTKGLILD